MDPTRMNLERLDAFLSLYAFLLLVLYQSFFERHLPVGPRRKVLTARIDPSLGESVLFSLGSC